MYFYLLVSVCLLDLIRYSHLASYETPLLCLQLNKHLPSSADSYKIECNGEYDRLFIAFVRYENDFDSYCYNKKLVSVIGVSGIASDSSVGVGGGDSVFRDRHCFAYKADSMRKKCNNKRECVIDANEFDNYQFKTGSNDANCNFSPKRMVIGYECIKHNTEDPSVPKYNICESKPISHVNEGFIHSPNYPKHYNSRNYCQMKIEFDPVVDQLLQLYLIDLHLEKPSLITANPTDYLEVNTREKLFGEISFELLANQSKDAFLVFKSDNFFNKRGFLLYFKFIRKPPTKKTTIITTTTTISTTTPTPTTTKTPDLLTALISSTTTFGKESLVPFKQKEPIVIIDGSSKDTTKSVVDPTHFGDKGKKEEYSFEAQNTITDPAKEKSSIFEDKTKLTFLILLAFLGVLCVGLLIALFIRKRNHSFSSKHRPNSELQHQQYADDSVAGLLLNASINTNSQTPNNNNNNRQQQTTSQLIDGLYEDINILMEQLDVNEVGETQTKKKNENIYCDDPVSVSTSSTTSTTIDSNKEKNVYCYIQSTNIPPPPTPTSAPPSSPTQQLDTSELNGSIYLNDTPFLNKKKLNESIKQETITITTTTTTIHTNDDYYKVPTNETVDTINKPVC